MRKTIVACSRSTSMRVPILLTRSRFSGGIYRRPLRDEVVAEDPAPRVEALEHHRCLPFARAPGKLVEVLLVHGGLDVVEQPLVIPSQVAPGVDAAPRRTDTIE